LGSLVAGTSESELSESSLVALLWRQVDVAKTASELDPDSSPDPPTTSTSGSRDRGVAMVFVQNVR
jgi:hypothetical protein